MTQLPLDFASRRSHAARLGSSPRLQATLAALREAGAGGLTTLELAQRTGSQAVHSDISEIRANGIGVTCVYARTTETGRRVYLYRLTP